MNMEKDLRPTSQHLAPVMVNFMSYQTLGHGLPLMNFPDTTPAPMRTGPIWQPGNHRMVFPIQPSDWSHDKGLSSFFFFFLLFLVLGDSDDI